jgi:hypothetical protein
MQTKQPLNIVIIQEILLFLAFVGVSAIMWAVANDGTGFWRGVSGPVLLAYPVRFAAEFVTRRRGKPLLRLMPDKPVG